LGLELGIPKRMIERHPFPGPGLAIRVMGEVTEDALRLIRESDAIMQEELRAFGYYNRVWQAFTVLLNVQSVELWGIIEPMIILSALEWWRVLMV